MNNKKGIEEKVIIISFLLGVILVLLIPSLIPLWAILLFIIVIAIQIWSKM